VLVRSSRIVTNLPELNQGQKNYIFVRLIGLGSVAALRQSTAADDSTLGCLGRFISLTSLRQSAT
jgi:hypothetical protein